MPSLISALVALSLLAPTQTDSAFEAGLQLRYQGSVSKVFGDEPGPTLKSVTLRYLVTEGKAGEGFQLAYLVSERGSGAWSWPERFGQVAFDGANRPVGSGNGPAAMFDYDGTPIVLPIDWPLLHHPEALRPGLNWNQDRLRFQVTGQEERAGRQCWKVEVTDRRGPSKLLWVEAGTDLLVAVEQHVFMGQGDEHRLALALVESRRVGPDDLQREKSPVELLLAIKNKLRRGEVNMPRDLTPEQLEIVNDSLEELQRRADKTQTRGLVAAIVRDVRAARERNDEVSQLRAKVLGKAVPEFSLETLDGKRLSQRDLDGKVTVLHFWDYRGEPLVEPYGQVGYLDFLYNKRRGDGVQVFGVAVDSRLGREAERRTAVKEIRKLRDFMNLGYSIALDTGDVLARFGDPQGVGAKLPLFVVVRRDGTVSHYSAGFYPIDADQGLKPLEQAVDAVLAE